MSKYKPGGVDEMSEAAQLETAAAPNTGAAAFVASGSEDFGFFPQQVVDNLIHVVISLGAEHWALRRRMFVLEKALEAAGALSKDAVELSEPSAEELTAWKEERDVFIRRAFGALARPGSPETGSNGEAGPKRAD